MKYLVGTLCGGLMESPAFYFDKPYQFVEAEFEQEAIEIYNKANECSFYYGSIIGREFRNVMLLKTPYMCIDEFERILLNLGYKQPVEVHKTGTVRAEIRFMSELTKAFEERKLSDEMRKIVADNLLKIHSSKDKKVLYHQMVSYEETDYKELDRDKFRLLDVKLKRTDEGMEFVGPYGKPFMIEFEV